LVFLQHNNHSNNLLQYRLRQCWCATNTSAIEVYCHWRLRLPWLRVPLLIFCNLELKNCSHGRPGIEPTTLDLGSQSGTYHLSTSATPGVKGLCLHLRTITNSITLDFIFPQPQLRNYHWFSFAEYTISFKFQCFHDRPWNCIFNSICEVAFWNLEAGFDVDNIEIIFLLWWISLNFKALKNLLFEWSHWTILQSTSALLS